MPRLASGLDPTSLSLSPGEGFLLSRIDGHTPVGQLRQIGGLPPQELEKTLDRWLAEGLIRIGDDDGDDEAPPPNGADPEPESEPDARAGLPDVDESLELSVEIQERVIEMAARLDRPYHELLGVGLDADARAIKKAYFGLSKVFHPDRYFRRSIGPFADLVETCFKRILEAYELLSDPVARQEVERQVKAAAAAATSKAAASLRSDPKRMRKRLDQLSGHGKLRAARRRKAKSFFEAGVAAFAAERWVEAAGSVRLAIAFDPKNDIYREKFAEVQRQAHQELATVCVAKADSASSLGDWAEALSHLVDAVHYRPFDAPLLSRAAKLSYQGAGDLKQAKELATSACELEPDVAMHHRVLGQVYAAAGLESNARRELRQALDLDPNDAEARSALRNL